MKFNRDFIFSLCMDVTVATFPNNEIFKAGARQWVRGVDDLDSLETEPADSFTERFSDTWGSVIAQEKIRRRNVSCASVQERLQIVKSHISVWVGFHALRKFRNQLHVLCRPGSWDAQEYKKMLNNLQGVEVRINDRPLVDFLREASTRELAGVARETVDYIVSIWPLSKRQN